MQWKKLKEELVYDGYRKIVRRWFLNPDGRELIFDIKQERDTVCIFGLTKEKEVILAKQFRQGPERFMCELPGGGIEKDEDPKVAAKREFLEETGYEGEFQFVGICYTCAYSPRKTHIFIALNCEKVDGPKEDPDEVIETILMDLEAFKKHLRSGDLTDTSTAYRAIDHLNLL